MSFNAVGGATVNGLVNGLLNGGTVNGGSGNSMLNGSGNSTNGVMHSNTNGVSTAISTSLKQLAQPQPEGNQRFSFLQQRLLCAVIHFFHRHIRSDADVLQRMEGNQTFRMFFEGQYHNKPNLNRSFCDSVHDCSPLHVCSFILGILHQGIFSVSAMIVSVIYLSRFKEVSHITLHACTWRPLFLTSLLLADKMWEDKPMRNSSLAKLFPVVTNVELNRMEHRFLKETRFNVLVKPDLFCSFCEKLLAEAVRPEIIECVNRSEYVATLQAEAAEMHSQVIHNPQLRTSGDHPDENEAPHVAEVSHQEPAMRPQKSATEDLRQPLAQRLEDQHAGVRAHSSSRTSGQQPSRSPGRYGQFCPGQRATRASKGVSGTASVGPPSAWQGTGPNSTPNSSLLAAQHAGVPRSQSAGAAGQRRRETGGYGGVAGSTGPASDVIRAQVTSKSTPTSQPTRSMSVNPGMQRNESQRKQTPSRTHGNLVGPEDAQQEKNGNNRFGASQLHSQSAVGMLMNQTGQPSRRSMPGRTGGYSSAQAPQGTAQPRMPSQGHSQCSPRSVGVQQQQMAMTTHHMTRADHRSEQGLSGRSQPQQRTPGGNAAGRGASGTASPAHPIPGHAHGATTPTAPMGGTSSPPAAQGASGAHPKTAQRSHSPGVGAPTRSSSVPRVTGPPSTSVLHATAGLPSSVRSRSSQPTAANYAQVGHMPLSPPSMGSSMVPGAMHGGGPVGGGPVMQPQHYGVPSPMMYGPMIHGPGTGSPGPQPSLAGNVAMRMSRATDVSPSSQRHTSPTGFGGSGTTAQGGASTPIHGTGSRGRSPPPVGAPDGSSGLPAQASAAAAYNTAAVNQVAPNPANRPGTPTLMRSVAGGSAVPTRNSLGSRRPMVVHPR